MNTLQVQNKYCLKDQLNSSRLTINIPKPVASLRHEPTHTTIYVFKKINWFHRFMLNLCFGLKYSKI